MPPKFTFSTQHVQENGAVPVGTKISIVPESGATHGIRIFFRHMSNTADEEAEEANKLHKLELRINHNTRPALARRKPADPEHPHETQVSPDDNHYKLYSGPFDWRTGGLHSFRAICVNDFKLISVHTTLTRRFDGRIEACYMQVI